MTNSGPGSYAVVFASNIVHIAPWDGVPPPPQSRSQPPRVLGSASVSVPSSSPDSEVVRLAVAEGIFSGAAAALRPGTHKATCTSLLRHAILVVDADPQLPTARVHSSTSDRKAIEWMNAEHQHQN